MKPILRLKGICVEDPHCHRHSAHTKIRLSLCLNTVLNKSTAVKLILKNSLEILLILSQLPQAHSIHPLPLPSFLLCQSHHHTHTRRQGYPSWDLQKVKHRKTPSCAGTMLWRRQLSSCPSGSTTVCKKWWPCTPNKTVSWQQHTRGRLFYSHAL